MNPEATMELALKVLAIYGLAFTLAFLSWLWNRLSHFAERVTAETLDGERVMADIVGASKLRVGEWQRTKVRFYDVNGEPRWKHGDGFMEMGVMRKTSTFTVRPPR
jgi:hypothetical protein